MNLEDLSRYVKKNVREQTAADLCGTPGDTKSCLDIQVPVVVMPPELAPDFGAQEKTYILQWDNVGARR